MGKLDGHGVQVDAVDVVVGEVHLDLLELPVVVLLREALIPGFLCVLHVLDGELVDGFVQEGGGAQCRFGNAELENALGLFLFGRELVDDRLPVFLENILHKALRENFRRVVGR